VKGQYRTTILWPYPDIYPTALFIPVSHEGSERLRIVQWLVVAPNEHHRSVLGLPSSSKESF
jgi:hypothetical protein